MTIILFPPKIQLRALHTAWNYLPGLGRAAAENKICPWDFLPSFSGKPAILDLSTEQKKKINLL